MRRKAVIVALAILCAALLGACVAATEAPEAAEAPVIADAIENVEALEVTEESELAEDPEPTEEMEPAEEPELVDEPELAEESPEIAEALEVDETPELSLVGRWECRDATIPHNWVCMLIFDENGRFVDRDGDQGYFTIEGRTLTLEFDEHEIVTGVFRVIGDRLLLVIDGLSVILDYVDGDAEVPETTEPLELSIVGRWECHDTTVPHAWMCLLIFDKNGRFVDRDGDWGDFTIIGDTLTLRFDGFLPVTFNVRISRNGNQMMLEEGHTRVILHRVDGTSESTGIAL
ncbi:MAG: hypothetical protein FWE19_08410 [Oscillospiraceae bacterium]|nr:hypothetical protein [Oscillospiraceae bacterium]